jgi:nucleotide-binding universal stress UspA family protein
MTEVRAALPLPDCSDQAVGGTATVIVVGLDGSPTSWDASSWAAGEALRANGRLVAVYVTPAVEPVAAVTVGVPLDWAAAEQARQQTAGQLKDEAEQRARDLGVPLAFVREIGDGARALTSVACAMHADLVVVGRSAGRQVGKDAASPCRLTGPAARRPQRRTGGRRRSVADPGIVRQQMTHSPSQLNPARDRPPRGGRHRRRSPNIAPDHF